MRYLTLFILLLFGLQPVNATELLELTPITPETVNDLEELQILGKGEFQAIAISPDNRTVAVGTIAGIWLYDWNNRTTDPVYQSHQAGNVSNIRFDATGSYLEVRAYYPHGDGYLLEIWQLDHTFNITRRIDSAYLSYDRRYLIYDDGSIFNTTTRETIQPDLPTTDSFDPWLHWMVMSPDESLMAVTGKENNTQLRLYNHSQNQYVGLLQMNPNPGPRYNGLSKIRFSDDGKWLIGLVVEHNLSFQMMVYRWSVDSILQNDTLLYHEGEELWHRSSARNVTIHTINQQVIIKSHSADMQTHTIDVISLQDGTSQQTVQSDLAIVHPASGDVITLDIRNGNEWTLVNATDNEIIGTLHNFDGRIDEIVFNTDGTRMLSINRHTLPGTNNTFVNLTNTITGERLSSSHMTEQTSVLIGFQANNRPIMVSTIRNQNDQNNRITIQDVVSGDTLHTFYLDTAPSVLLNENGQLLYIATGSNHWLYDISQPQNPISIALPDDELSQGVVFLDPHGEYVVLIESEGDSQLLRLWDVQQQEEVTRITNRRIVLNRFADNIQFLNNNELLAICEYRNVAAGNLDYQITVWRFDDLLSQTYPSPRTNIPGMLCRLDYNKVGKLVFPTYGEGIQAWSLSNYSSNITGRSDGDDWWRVAKFSTDGDVIFGIDYFGEMTAWQSPYRMSELATFQIAPWQINEIDFIRDGKMMVLTAEDGTVRLWGIPASGR